jgi:thioredoxin-dependent peroxiredoxin
MIDPLKATKGRRMSKKTRKKSSKTVSKAASKTASKTASKPAAAKTASGKAASAKSTASAKTTVTKTGKAAVTKPAKTTKKQLGKAAPKTAPKTAAKALPKAAPKPSKPVPAPSKPPAPSVATLRLPAKAATAKPETAKPPAPKAVEEQTAVPPAGKSAMAEGAKAPAFRLPRDGGDTVSLADYAGKKLVLFFYPRADTPGCTKEAIDFTRLASAFAQHQTAVLGVSADPLKAQEAFRNKHQLTTPLVSDEQHEMLEAYGAWGEKSMYGRTFQGVLRTTVLIGADGRIIRIWRHVKVDGHADEVLAAVQAL